MPADQWTRSIAAVTDARGKVRGTAFFVGPDVAMTCVHVLTAAGDGPVSLRMAGAENAEKVIGVDADDQLDLALVRVAWTPDRPWVPMSPDTALIGRSVHSRGFPRDHDVSKYPQGFPMDPARLSGGAVLMWRGQPVDMLVLAEAAVDRGMSGAPAVDAETQAVLGVLRFSEEGAERALAVPATAALARWPKLPTRSDQEPRSFPELTEAVPEALASTAWEKFDPSRLHCVVVGSEAMANGQGLDSLAGLVKVVLSTAHASLVWQAFTRAWQGRRLLAGAARDFPGQYSKANVRLATFDVLDAFASPASLDLAVRLLVEADLALFDVTGFEPGVMLLLGIRATTRRGVTVNSHAGGWVEGEPLDRPFNLSDLSLASHSAPEKSFVDEDPRIGRLAKRVVTGFDQQARHPHYLDMPVFDALRQLGSKEDAWGSIPLDEEVLVLCSYAAEYYPVWLGLRSQVQTALSEHDVRPKIVRLQDLATPQLVSQSLYERIRRCAGCIADWTGSSPSTFFELGVRMAVSPWGVVQIAEESWLDQFGRTRPEPVTPDSRCESCGHFSAKVTHRGVEQIELMRALLAPLIYRGTPDAGIGERIARKLVEIRGLSAGSTGSRVREVAADALSRTSERLPDLVAQLTDEADALHHKGRIKDNVPQALFYEVRDLKLDQESAALERRLAAWLYLEHRFEAGGRAEDDRLRQEWLRLGELVAADLLLSDDESDILFAKRISTLVRESPGAVDLPRAITFHRRRGDALSRGGMGEEAKEAYETAVSLIDDALGARSPSPETTEEVAELFGLRGGLLRRLGRTADALESYRRGADLESSGGLLATYNRANAIKLALITGDRTVGELRDDLVALRTALELRLGTDERAADDAWLWADLGDVRTLLADEAGAEAAYRAFAAKATTESPTSTLSVLKEIVAALRAHDDPDASRTAVAVERVEAVLVS